jgi:fermentation-respiration switch protein FrsA (DUF1100 family)
VTLAFDHRHFGESRGLPRQYEHPGRKVEDFRAAFGFLASRPEIDFHRLGAVGVCSGAGYLAPAVAGDDRIKAWGAVAGFFHDAGRQRAAAPPLARKFFASLGGLKEQIWIESTGHIDFYDHPERVQTAADQLTRHFRAHL